MSAKNATDAEQIAVTFSPMAADPLLMAPFEIAMAMYRHWLGATSRLLRDQCAHLQNLAECDDPLNMLVCQTEFAEKSVVAGLDELRRGVDTITDTACGHFAAGGSLPQ
ncbi:hypothetical protein WMC41_11615 [Shinella yambaruensis]|uniref:hypothetical protein n=1 Tax=Shinella yambaruensis TaxID=415996 RepID=UPI003D78F749